jgi:hypothetical protein
VRLQGAQIGGSLDCRRGKVDILDLATASVKGIFIWTDVCNPENTLLDLRNAAVLAIVDEERSWPKKENLKLDGLVYARISESAADAKTRLGWLSRLNRFTLQPYQQLAKVLREAGDASGSGQVLFEMEDQLRRQKVRPMYMRFWNWVLRVTIGYGQKSARAFGCLAILTLVGCVLFGCGYLGGAMVPNQKEAYETFEEKGYPPDYYPQFNPLIYSFEHCFPLVNLGVTDHWAPNFGSATRFPVLHFWGLQRMRDFMIRGVYPFRWNFPIFLRVCFWLQVPLGWGLATLFVAGLTGVVKSG